MLDAQLRLPILVVPPPDNYAQLKSGCSVIKHRFKREFKVQGGGKRQIKKEDKQDWLASDDNTHTHTHTQLFFKNNSNLEDPSDSKSNLK